MDTSVTAIADGSLRTAGNIPSTQAASLDSISQAAGQTVTGDTTGKH
ncbi:hypothetical protein ABZZ20_36040 [Streptomyces sp. NPDC006430]